MCIHIYVCVYVYTHMYIYIYTYVYKYVIDAIRHGQTNCRRSCVIFIYTQAAEQLPALPATKGVGTADTKDAPDQKQSVINVMGGLGSKVHKLLLGASQGAPQ